MKKAFLLLGFFGSYAAHAQLKDVFDIQKHLEQKTKERKEIKIMPIFRQQFADNLFTGKKNHDFIPFTLSNRDMIISLPVDNMPCVVPDMKLFKIMPNINNKNIYNPSTLSPENYFPGKIPNPATPFSLAAIKE